MAKVTASSSTRPRRPGLTPESREKQLTALAVDLAEQQLLDGTASSQIITHYLKLATEEAALKREKLARENELMSAKTEQIKAQQHSEELYQKAIKAMQLYGGHGSRDESEDDY